MARVYVNPPVQQKQRVYISGPKVGAPQTKQRVYVSGPQTGQVAQPKMLQPSKTGFSGLAQNAKTDFGSFAKGILGLGRQAVTHPIDTTEKVYGIGKEIVKGVPAGARLMAHTMANFPETQRQGIAALKQLHQTPLEDQKKALNDLLQKIGESPEAKANPDKRRLAQLGTAIMGNYTQYSRPGEKIYNEPFSFALDAIPMAKSLGVGNVVASGASKARSLPVVSKAVDTAQDLFIPGSKLKRAGYGKVAEDLQKTGTAMRQSQEGIIKSTVSQFKDLTKEERGQFFDAIDSLRRTPDVAPSHPNPRVQAKIDWYMNEELPKIQKMAGYRPKGTDVPTSPPIQNYLHHLFTPSKETSMGGKLSAPQRGFLKQSKDVEGFVKDPVVSIAAVKSKAATANIKEGFIQRVTSQYARPAETVTEFKNGTILAKDTGEPLIKWKGQYLPKDLGEELLRYEGKGHTIVDTMLTPLRVFNRNWKPLATAVRPRYHLRNVIGNVYNASFVGGAGLHRYPEAVWQQMKGHIATQMKEGTFSGQVYSALFKTPPEHKMIKMATEDGVIGKGFFAADINDLAEIANTTEDFAKAISKMENPAEIYRIPVLRQWLHGSTAIGQAFEDNARLALYISQLKSGATRATAKAYVNKHLFDYINGLGEGDRAIKAIIPFWSWTRFNVPLQYGALWKNPIRNVVAQEFGKPYVQQSEQNNPEYQFLSQREKDLGAFKIGETTKDGKTSDKYMRTQGVLPVQDVSKVFDPENAGLSPLFDMLNQGYRHISPPTNPSQNLDYFGRPVEQYPGEVKNFLGMPVRGTTKEILQGIPALSELNKGIGGSYNDANRPDLASRIGTIFSPTSNTIQDREKNRQYVESDYNTLVKGDFAPGLESNFKFVIKGLLDNPSDAVLNENKNTLANLLKQQGYTDEGIKILVKKSIESVIKDRATIDMPGKAKSIINQVEVNNILGKANKLNSFYTK